MWQEKHMKIRRSIQRFLREKKTKNPQKLWGYDMKVQQLVEWIRFLRKSLKEPIVTYICISISILHFIFSSLTNFLNQFWCFPFWRYTQRNFLRIFPKSSRLDSSNYNPLLGWTHGAQMVALNMQVPTICSQMSSIYLLCTCLQKQITISYLMLLLLLSMLILQTVLQVTS